MSRRCYVNRMLTVHNDIQPPFPCNTALLILLGGFVFRPVEVSPLSSDFFKLLIAACISVHFWANWCQVSSAASWRASGTARTPTSCWRFPPKMKIPRQLKIQPVLHGNRFWGRWKKNPSRTPPSTTMNSWLQWLMGLVTRLTQWRLLCIRVPTRNSDKDLKDSKTYGLMGSSDGTLLRSKMYKCVYIW